MHNCGDCEHKLVKFCKKCGKVYCEKCNRLWEDPCTRSHMDWTSYSVPCGTGTTYMEATCS